MVTRTKSRSNIMRAYPLVISFLGLANGFSLPNSSSSSIWSLRQVSLTSRCWEEKRPLPSTRRRDSVRISAKISNTDVKSPQILEEERVPTTFVEAFEVFLCRSYNGPRLVVILLLATAFWRATLPQPTSIADIAMVAATMVFWCFQEHFLHGRVLHSEMNWYGKEIHEGHHAKPYHHVSIDPAWLMLTWLGCVHVGLRWFLPLPLALSATFAYASSGLWYEFLHFIVHTRVRFRKGSYLEKMKNHHARHHLIDHRYWLGFSLPAVDDLFGTNPSVAEVRRMYKQT